MGIGVTRVGGYKILTVVDINGERASLIDMTHGMYIEIENASFVSCFIWKFEFVNHSQAYYLLRHAKMYNSTSVMLAFYNVAVRKHACGYTYLTDTDHTTVAFGKTDDKQELIVANGIDEYRMPPLTGHRLFILLCLLKTSNDFSGSTVHVCRSCWSCVERRRRRKNGTVDEFGRIGFDQS
jgi:hypothetical protein